MREFYRHRDIQRKAGVVTGLLFALNTPTLFAEAIGIGSTRNEVLETYGPPRSHAQLGTKEIFTYAEGSVTYENGRVVDFRFHGHEPAIRRMPSSERLSPRDHENVYIDRPVSVAAVTVQTPFPAKTPLKSFGILLFVVGSLALLKIMTSRKRGRRADQLTTTVAQPPPLANRSSPSPSSILTEIVPASISRLDLVTLRKLEWRRVEELVQGYFEKTGLRAERSAIGADGGIDLFLYSPAKYKPIACVQCKMRSRADIRVKDIREFYGVMVSEALTTGYFISTRGFTSDAKAFAVGKPIQLIDGPELVVRFEQLSTDDHAAIVTHAFRGDYITPTCASCDQKMVFKDVNGGFWSCKSYPRCRSKLPASAGRR